MLPLSLQIHYFHSIFLILIIFYSGTLIMSLAQRATILTITGHFYTCKNLLLSNYALTTKIVSTDIILILFFTQNYTYIDITFRVESQVLT